MSFQYNPADKVESGNGWWGTTHVITLSGTPLRAASVIQETDSCNRSHVSLT